MGNVTINCGNADAQSHDINYLASSCAGELLRPSEAETPIPDSANTDGDADPAYIALLRSTLSLYTASSCAGELLRPSEAETPIPDSANTYTDADPAYIALLLSTLSL